MDFYYIIIWSVVYRCKQYLLTFRILNQFFQIYNFLYFLQMLATPNSIDTITNLNYKHLLKRANKSNPFSQSPLNKEKSQHKQSARSNQYGQKLYIRSSFLNPIENMITLPQNIKLKKQRKELPQRKVKTQATVIQDGDIEKYRQNRLPEIRKSLAHEQDIYQQVRNFIEFGSGSQEQFMRSSKYKRLKFHKTKYGKPHKISHWKKNNNVSNVEKSISSPRKSVIDNNKNNSAGYKLKTQLIRDRHNCRIDSEKHDEKIQLPLEKLEKFQEKLRRQASLSPISSLVTQTRIQAIYQCEFLKAAKQILGKHQYEKINVGLYKDPCSNREVHPNASNKQTKNMNSLTNLKKRKYDKKNVKQQAEKRQNIAELALKVNLERLRSQKQKVFEKISL